MIDIVILSNKKINLSAFAAAGMARGALRSAKGFEESGRDCEIHVRPGRELDDFSRFGVAVFPAGMDLFNERGEASEVSTAAGTQVLGDLGDQEVYNLAGLGELEVKLIGDRRGELALV